MGTIDGWGDENDIVMRAASIVPRYTEQDTSNDLIDAHFNVTTNHLEVEQLQSGLALDGLHIRRV